MREGGGERGSSSLVIQLCAVFYITSCWGVYTALSLQYRATPIRATQSPNSAVDCVPHLENGALCTDHEMPNLTGNSVETRLL